jgi:hypothetical protein
MLTEISEGVSDATEAPRLLQREYSYCAEQDLNVSMQWSVQITESMTMAVGGGMQVTRKWERPPPKAVI